MAINKVVYGNTTVMDVTDTTAEPSDVKSGKVFYDKSGNRQIGTALMSAEIVVGEERLIGEWTEDGVTYDLYEKVISLGNLPNTAAKTVAHGVTNKVRFVDSRGSAYGNNNLSIPFVNATGSLYIYMGVGNNQVTIQTNSDRSGLVGYAYLYYIRNKS